MPGKKYIWFGPWLCDYCSHELQEKMAYVKRNVPIDRKDLGLTDSIDVYHCKNCGGYFKKEDLSVTGTDFIHGPGKSISPSTFVKVV